MLIKDQLFTFWHEKNQTSNSISEMSRSRLLELIWYRRLPWSLMTYARNVPLLALRMYSEMKEFTAWQPWQWYWILEVSHTETAVKIKCSKTMKTLRLIGLQLPLVSTSVCTMNSWRKLSARNPTLTIVKLDNSPCSSASAPSIRLKTSTHKKGWKDYKSFFIKNCIKQVFTFTLCRTPCRSKQASFSVVGLRPHPGVFH